MKVDNFIALRALQTPEIRQKAADLGAAIHAEPDGVAEAGSLMEGCIVRE